MNNTCEKFSEMESLVCDIYDEDVLFCKYEGEDILRDYISNIFISYIREKVIEDIRSVNDNWDLTSLVDEIFVSLPAEIIDFYKKSIDFSWVEFPMTDNSASV